MHVRSLVIVAWGATTACYSGVDRGGGAAQPGTEGDDGASGEGDGSGGEDAGDGDPATACVDDALGATPMRRLTAVQYANTVADLFDGAIAVGEGFPATRIDNGYTNDPVNNVVSELAAEKIMVEAEAIGAQLVESFDARTGCAGDDDACATAYVHDLADRAFRRPLRDEEIALLDGVYAQARAEADAAAATGRTVTAILQMPQLLYLVEEGQPLPDRPDVIALDDHSLASRLSYFLWDSLPDAELRAAADAGELHTADQLEAQAERMLASPRAVSALTRFHAEWLHTLELDPADKNAELFPEFDQPLVDAMHEELRATVERLWVAEGGTVRDLLTTSSTVVDARLADLYGVPAPQDGGWAPVDLGADRRSGVLTLPLVLSAASGDHTTRTIGRGLLVRTQLLCDGLPPPPPDVQNQIEFPPGASERDKWAALEANPTCAGCHTMINPVGLGFEHYDPIGRFREVDEGGVAIDASGSVAGLDDPDFEGAPELAERLLASGRVERCLAEHLVRYTFGKLVDQADACTLDGLAQTLIEADGDLQALLRAFVRSDAFRLRAVEEGEGG